MTYRERRMRKADRLRDWAAKREDKSAAAFGRASAIADNIPFGQPILVGHHSERHARRDQERIHNGMRAGVEHSKKAGEMESRADNIEAAADRAIYSDDHDAIEKLEARIVELTAQIERMKYVNKEVRKGDGWSGRITPALTPEEVRDLELAAKYSGCVGYPKYALTNLRGNIGRNQKRLEELNRARTPEGIARQAAHLFCRAAAVWVEGNNSGDPKTLARSEEKCEYLRTKAEELLAPFGITCDYPGLYPSYELDGHTYHELGDVMRAVKA